ncbi:MAG: cupin domain-containing protein [Myxococcota bacterium]
MRTLLLAVLVLSAAAHAQDEADAGSVPAERAAPPAPWAYPFVFEQPVSILPHGAGAQVHVLVDRTHAGAQKASLVLFSASSHVEEFPHRHDAAELVYVVEGKARVRGLPRKWIDLGPGDAALVPAQAAHSVWLLGTARQPTKVLTLHAPAEEETPPKGVAASLVEVRKTPAGAPLPTVMKASAAKSYVIGAGQGSVRILLEGKAAYAGRLTANSGMAVPEHVHGGEAEILYVLAGEGELTASGKTLTVKPGHAVHMPPAQPHAFKVTSTTPFEAVQFYAPSGPEQRFKPRP